MMRSDGRIVTRTRLPEDVIVKAEVEAVARGVPLADHLGDVVAEELPGFIAEAVRAKLNRMGRLAAQIVGTGEAVPVVLGRLAAEHTAAHACPVETASTNGSAPVLRGTPNDFSSRPPSTLSIGASGRLMASTAHTKPDANGTSN